MQKVVEVTAQGESTQHPARAFTIRPWASNHWLGRLISAGALGCSVVLSVSQMFGTLDYLLGYLGVAQTIPGVGRPVPAPDEGVVPL